MASGSRRHRPRDLVWLITSALLPLPWLVAEAFGGFGLPAVWVAALAGLAILGAAFLLSWSTELAEQDIPQSLALLVLAFVSVLPEYAVDLHFAWRAGQDPSYAPYAVANMTGANRLLIGLGWAVVVLLACRRSRSRALVVHGRQGLELRFLLIATLYSFTIPLDGRLSLFDSAVLLGIFLLYVRSASRSEQAEVELMGPPALIDHEFGDLGRRLWSVGLLGFAACAIFLSAEPFAESLVTIGRATAIDEFILVQWVAPLASESPEFLVAILFVLRGRPSIGLGALISSKVNQWTLLVGALPIAYCVSAGSLSGLPLDARQTEELWLTSMQSLLAVVMLANLSFSRREAIWLAGLFLAQLAFPSTSARYGFIALYGGVTVAFLAGGGPPVRRGLLGLLGWGAPAGARDRAASSKRCPRSPSPQR